MRIGVVSDTHNHLPNARQIVALLNGARVDRVVHTGDVTQRKTLEVLAGLDAPLYGVFGNNDLERDDLERACRDLAFHFVDPPFRATWADRRILVVHDPADLDARALGGVDVALHGHDHRHRSERHHGALVFNPGECAGHMVGHNQIGIVDLISLETDILRF